MTKKYLIILLFYLTKSTLGFSQADTTGTSWIQAGYFGENVTHYGFSVGYGYSLYDRPIFNDRRGKIKLHQLYVEPNLSFFVHPNNQFFMGLLPDLGYKFTTHTNWNFQLGIGAGVVRTFYNAETFEADGNGGFEKIKLAGKWSLGTTISAGFGKAIDKKKLLVLCSQFRLVNEHFYNQKTLLRPIFQFGISKKI